MSHDSATLPGMDREGMSALKTLVSGVPLEDDPSDEFRTPCS